MGWASGTYVCEEVWDSMRRHIAKENRADVLAELILVLQAFDWDCEGDIDGRWLEAEKALWLAGVYEA